MLEQLKVHVGATMAELNQGSYEVAPPLFLNALCAPGTWDELPKSMRKTFVCNAPTVITDFEDPTLGTVNIDQLTRTTVPTLLTDGGRSRPWAAPVVKRPLRCRDAQGNSSRRCRTRSRNPL